MQWRLPLCIPATQCDVEESVSILSLEFCYQKTWLYAYLAQKGYGYCVLNEYPLILSLALEAELIVTLETTDLASTCGLVSSVYSIMAEDNGVKL